MSTAISKKRDDEVEIMVKRRVSPVAVLCCCFAAALAMWCVPVFAHHGISAYSDHLETLKGTVTEFAWSNPHCQIYFDVVDDKQKVVHWSCETNSPARLTRAGWTRNTLKPKDQVTLSILPAKNGTPVGFLRGITLADGTKLTLTEK
jgi:hypothetical protein